MANEFQPIKVRLKNVTKRFPGIVANQDISLECRTGHIHAVLGENGAGKTTLMRILAGLYRPDEGHIEIDGRIQRFRNPRDARDAGIAMVHQHFSLIPALTVAENLALSDSSAPFLYAPRRETDSLQRRAERLGFDNIRLDKQVSELSMGERQRVEIFRLILEGARILVLDEPTSILAPLEAEHLFEHLRQLALDDSVILLVTHKIDHVVAVADYVTILWRGRVVASRPTSEVNAEKLAKAITGDSFTPALKRRARQSSNLTADEDVLRVHGLCVAPTMSPCGVVEASFSLASGEVLGIAGISGNGQDELIGAITGAVEHGGDIKIDGLACESDRRDMMAYIPADRRGMGAALPLSVEENLSIRDYRMPPISSGAILRMGEIRRVARERIKTFDISPPDPSIAVDHLSGGNLLKVILGRELAGDRRLVIAELPTSGLDIATVDFVHCELVNAAERGAGVLLVSEDLDELIAVCDRIMVFHAGRPVGEFEADEAYRHDIALAMSGIRSNSQALEHAPA